MHAMQPISSSLPSRFRSPMVTGPDMPNECSTKMEVSMANDLIMRVAASVFGPGWETDMALALNLPEDALRRWAKELPKPGLYAELAVFVAERRDELEGLAEELKHRGP